MRKTTRRCAAVVGSVALMGLVAATASAPSASGKASATIKACALLPDTTTSTRYTLFDAPYLKKAFKKANVSASVLNALGSPTTQRAQAQQCLLQGAKVILLDQLDPARMDALLLLASTANSIGYSGRGDFLMEPDGRLHRRGECEIAPFVYASAALLPAP